MKNNNHCSHRKNMEIKSPNKITIFIAYFQNKNCKNLI